MRLALARPGDGSHHTEDSTDQMDASSLQLIILPAGLIAIAFAIYLARDVLARDTGTPEMEAVAGTIYEGAVAFIRRQYRTIAILALFASVALLFWWILRLFMQLRRN